MKICFVISSPVMSPSNGVKIQALTWKEALEQEGHNVTLINMWDVNDWKSFDIIHCFDYGEYLSDFVNLVKKINPNIVLSSIIDANYSPLQYKIASYWGCRFLRIASRYYTLRQIRNDIKMYFVRSQYERKFISYSYGIENDRISIIPLSFRLVNHSEENIKESFCLHVSLLTDERKNVRRLIDAAKKYNFKLILAGKLRNKDEVSLLNKWICGAKNIEYVGFVSDEELVSLYKRAKVFALPSTYEGVGLVALEAAEYGCNIVVTKLGGPKEYYNNMAFVVDPFNVDEIGRAVIKALNCNKYQPELKYYIENNFNLQKTVIDLVKCYQMVLNSSLL